MSPQPDAGPNLEPIVVASTFREAPTARREALARTLTRLGGTMPEHVLLHTCHRVELIAVVDRSWSGPGIGGVRSARGADAVERALLVAGGLDSAVMAEEQLQGQVREAYRLALDAGSTGPLLNELFRRALRFGRKVRSLAQPRGDGSLAERAVRLAHDRLMPEAGSGSAMVIGTGTMGQILAAELARRGMKVTVASRTLEAAERLCGELPSAVGCRASILADTLDRVPTFDLVALATRSPRPVLDRRHLGPLESMPLVIDLSAPAAITGEAAAALGERLIDLDRIGGEGRSTLDDAALRHVHSLARRERDGYLDWLATRSSGDALGLIQRHATEVRLRHLDRLRRGGRFDAEQLAAVDAAARAMLGEVLHDPILRVRHDPDAAAVARRLFGIDA